jgi:hypothetical protein
MPLTAKSKNLLREIYGVSVTGGEIIISNPDPSGLPFTNYPFAFRTGIKQQLELAIAEIDLNPNASDRVTEILDEYQSWDLDPSPIEKDGYSFRHRRSLKRIMDVLTPYTRIYASLGGGGNNMMNRG